MKSTGFTVFAAALGVIVSASKCEPDPPPPSPAGAAPAESANETAPAAPTTADAASTSTAPSPRDLLLAELSSRLDQVQIAKPDQRVETGGDIALEPLLGITRAELRAALGAPRTCEKNEVTTADGRKLPVAPCQTNDDWFYSFYHLPRASVGGGPELLLQFDDRGACVSARWMFTQ